MKSIKVWGANALRVLEQPIPFWVSPIGLLIIFLLWQTYSWTTDLSLIYIVPTEYSDQLKYQIGIRTIPVLIGALGAFSVAVFITWRNKLLDKEKHERDLAHKQIDAANGWLLSVKGIYDKLKPAITSVQLMHDQSRRQSILNYTDSLDTEYHISDNLIGLSFLKKNGNYSDPTGEDYSNILSVQTLLYLINNSIRTDLNIINQAHSMLNDNNRKGGIHIPDGELKTHVFDSISNLEKTSNKLASFLIKFPDIAENSINQKHQLSYMKLLRFYLLTDFIPPPPIKLLSGIDSSQ